LHPTQAVEIFGNISTPFGTLTILHTHRKFYGDRSMGNPPSGELNPRGVAKYSDLGAISETVQDKLVLITNRKSHMSFRLVPKSVTLNDLERRSGRYFALFQRNR